MKIYAQKGGTSTRQERLDLATLLIKFGYVVSCGKAKIDGKAVDYVEFSTKPQTSGALFRKRSRPLLMEAAGI